MSDENGTKVLTPEQEEEMKFKSKYPNSQKPGGSVFIQKMLHRGHKKYFDSGDYNMAKSKIKQHPAQQQAQQQQQVQQNTMQTVPGSPSVPNPNNTSLNNSALSTPIARPPQQNDNNHNSTLNSNVSTPISINNLNTPTPVAPNETTTTTNNLSSSSSNDNNNHFDHHQSSSLSPSIYSSPNIINSNHNSNSSDNISTDNLLLNDEEIGHEIATPDTVTVLRKHSNIQSKLATTTTPNLDKD